MLTSNPEGSWMLRLLVPHDLQALRMQHQHVVMITTIKATSSSTKWLEPTAAVARLPTGRWVPDSCTPSTTNDLSVQEKWKGVVLEPKCQGPHKHDCMFHTQLVPSNMLVGWTISPPLLPTQVFLASLMNQQTVTHQSHPICSSYGCSRLVPRYPTNLGELPSSGWVGRKVEGCGP